MPPETSPSSPAATRSRFFVPARSSPSHRSSQSFLSRCLLHPALSWTQSSISSSPLAPGLTAPPILCLTVGPTRRPRCLSRLSRLALAGFSRLRRLAHLDLPAQDWTLGMLTWLFVDLSRLALWLSLGLSLVGLLHGDALRYPSETPIDPTAVVHGFTSSPSAMRLPRSGTAPARSLGVANVPAPVVLSPPEKNTG